jgi:alpha-glucosidase
VVAVRVTRAVAEPHHDGSEAYLSDPNPGLGETVTALVRVPLAAGIEHVVARVVHDAEPYRVVALPDRTTDTERWWRVEIRAHNPVTSYRFHLRDRSGRTAWLTQSGVHGWDVTDATDFRLTTEHRPPAWARRTVWYQVFPDRFARSVGGAPPSDVPSWAHLAEWDDPVETTIPAAMHQLYGGTLDGITEHLDHLVELGVTGLYSCPFFPARSNHRYDASSFDHVDPLLGGDAALHRLVAEAGRRGIRVMGDLTTNHSGDHHEWFRAAVDDPASPTREYYAWKPDGTPELWHDVPTLPKFDHSSPAMRRAVYEGPDSIAGRFLGPEFGLAAMRIDVANMTGRLRDVDLNRVCAEGLRRTIDTVRPDAWLLAEHFHDASPDLDGGGWHGTMNYPGFTRPTWTWLIDPSRGISAFGDPGPLPSRSGRDVVRSARAFMAHVPYSVALSNMNLLGSHDTARWACVAGSRDRHAVGAALLCTWPGSPSIFAGDEIGLGRDADWDVPGRLPFPWHAPSTWDRELLATYRELVRLRTASAALSVGGMRWVSVGDDHLVYVRESRDEAMLVHVARAAHAPVEVDLGTFGFAGAELAAGAEVRSSGPVLRLEAEGPTWRVVGLEAATR